MLHGARKRAEVNVSLAGTQLRKHACVLVHPETIKTITEDQKAVLLALPAQRPILSTFDV